MKYLSALSCALLYAVATNWIRVFAVYIYQYLFIKCRSALELIKETVHSIEILHSPSAKREGFLRCTEQDSTLVYSIYHSLYFRKTECAQTDSRLNSMIYSITT